MRVTACYIVKNEERNIRRSLASVKDSVDELIVVDTGSVDSTKKIASEYGAKVFDYKWQNDFSEARNYALKKASGDWIIFLDADEYFTENTKSNIRQVIINNTTKDLLLVSMNNIDADTGENLLKFNAPRIFKNQENIKYCGRIHEELRINDKPVENICIINAEKLTLMHTGYSKQYSMEKAERNLKLLLKELEETNQPGNLYAYIAECYVALGLYNKVKYYADLDISNGRRNTNYASKSWRIMIDLANRNKDYKKRLEVSESAVKNFPEIPEFHAEYAECLAADEKYDEAIEEARRAIVCYENYDSIEPSYFNAGMLKTLKHRSYEWQMMKKNGTGKYQEIKNEFDRLYKIIAGDVALLFRLILCSMEGIRPEKNTIYDELKDLLPTEFECIFDKWEKDEKISEGIDGYITLLKYVIKYSSDEQLKTYISLILNFKTKEKINIADILMDNNKMECAWIIYETIPVNDIEKGQNFWLNAGKCQYELGNYIIALECFANAKKYKEVNGELDAYVLWTERWGNSSD